MRAGTNQQRMKCHTTEERKEQDVDNAASQNTKALALWIDNMQGLKDVGFNAEFHPLVEVLYALNSVCFIYVSDLIPNLRVSYLGNHSGLFTN